MYLGIGGGGGGSAAFDPFLGVWLVPDWEEMLETVYTPERFMVYRANGNDPVNRRERADIGKFSGQ